jgi:hypothetical protein
MRQALIALLLGLGLAPTVAGCATITTGTTQPINFDSEPQQAECTLTREGATLGKVTTPAPLIVKRHASTIHVVCHKAGYEDGRVVMNSRFETASAGNFLVGGIIGVMVDASSGANSRYESNVMVRLTPMSPADAAAAATRAQTAPASPPVAVAATAPPTPATAPTSVPAATPAPTFTGPWRAQNVIIPEKSGGNCTRTGTFYSLDLTGDTLTVSNENGQMFTATVPADGAVRQTFKSPTGGTYEMVGNARTRALEVVNNNAGCRWQLTPVSAAAASPPVTLYDGDYRGGLQLGALLAGNSYERVGEAIRTVEVHVVNGVATGTVRQERCSGIGTVNLTFSPTGGVTGEMDALVTTTCAPLKVQVEGRVNGDLLTAIATSGRASTEFSLRRTASP